MIKKKCSISLPHTKPQTQPPLLYTHTHTHTHTPLNPAFVLLYECDNVIEGTRQPFSALPPITIIRSSTNYLPKPLAA